jgi:hypothetical protein
MSNDPCNNYKSCVNDPKMNIDQNINGVDQFTCMANTLLQSLAASCDINIDYNALLKCNSSKIDSMRIPIETLNQLNRTAQCIKLKVPTFDINGFMNRAVNAFKFLRFLMSPSSAGLRVPVQCDDGVQSASGDPCDPSSCFFIIRYKFLYEKFKNHKNLTDSLCGPGMGTVNPVMSLIDTADFPPDFENWLKDVQSGNITPPYVYTISEIPRQRSPAEKLACENLAFLKHALLLIGSSCETINGQTYINYKFKDTYNTTHGQVSWTLRVLTSLGNGSYVPFSPGMAHPFAQSRITSARVTNCEAVKKEYNKCCTPTPSVTPTKTPYVSVTPTSTMPSTTPTRTGTPYATPSTTPYETPAETPYPTPTPTTTPYETPIPSATPYLTPTTTPAASPPVTTPPIYSLNNSVFMIP